MEELSKKIEECWLKLTDCDNYEEGIKTTQEVWKEAQKNFKKKFIEEVKTKGFYDETIEKDLIDFINEVNK